MDKKVFVVILVLSVVVTYGAAFMDVLLSGSVVAGKSGIPFRFGSSSLFGGSGIDYPILLVDIVFWVFVIWGIWKLLQKVSGKK